MQKETLTPPEWIAFSLFLVITTTLTAVAYVNRTPELPYTSPDAVYISKPEIHVSVNGAVKYPQSIILRKGATLRDLLEQVELTPEADITALNQDKVLRKGQKVKIPCKKKGRAKKAKKK